MDAAYKSPHDTLDGAARDAAHANLDPEEVARFASWADDWWDATGKFKPLHAIGPARLQFIKDNVCAVHERDAARLKPYDGLSALDIGCGGGLICEPLTRLGAQVTGIDPAGSGIEAARVHAIAGGLEIDYRNVQAEALVEAGETYDIVLALEVIEHVPSPSDFAATCAALVAPGGLLVMSTINRTAKAFALAIVGAEYVLRWLPRGTHQWNKFVTPDEMRRAIEANALVERDTRGMTYNPLKDRWSLAVDTDVNYLMAASRAA
ncbi:MAG: bifunctional 2-polyprenyl-6-hydroxyphenol methylase/3-demethylubiquinol 3-O-methyltransferase UbiG [Pseudomonadota bacterium]